MNIYNCQKHTKTGLPIGPVTSFDVSTDFVIILVQNSKNFLHD